VLQGKKECMGPQVLHPCALLCSQCVSNDSLENMGFHSATKITKILCKSDHHTLLLQVPIGDAWSLGCEIFLKILNRVNNVIFFNQFSRQPSIGLWVVLVRIDFSAKAPYQRGQTSQVSVWWLSSLKGQWVLKKFGSLKFPLP
jgi:hypothetical protein